MQARRKGQIQALRKQVRALEARLKFHTMPRLDPPPPRATIPFEVLSGRYAFGPFASEHKVEHARLKLEAEILQRAKECITYSRAEAGFLNAELLVGRRVDSRPPSSLQYDCYPTFEFARFKMP